jgi:hypothetical protein
MAELGPTTVYGDLITTGDLYAKGTNGIYFNDTNTEIWEDTSGNLSFKDDVFEGTTTLRELQIRKAYCKNNAGHDNTMVCYLDDDISAGNEILVEFSITQGGAALNQAIPRLTDGDLIFVTYVAADGKWYCVSPFQNSCISTAECA